MSETKCEAGVQESENPELMNSAEKTLSVSKSDENVINDGNAITGNTNSDTESGRKSETNESRTEPSELKYEGNEKDIGLIKIEKETDLPQTIKETDVPKTEKGKTDLPDMLKKAEKSKIIEQVESSSQINFSKESNMSAFSSEDYELIDGHYYYTDMNSGMRYRYSMEKGEWVDIREEDGSHQTVTDTEGRTYYYADKLYLCRDKEGHVFFMDEKGEWQPWEEHVKTQTEQSNWYFYQGDDTFYRDKKTGAVYKLNKEDNKWEKFEGKLRSKRRRMDDDEEFDTDEEGSEEEGDGVAPPGAASDPNISFDGTTYTKVDPSDMMKYEWDVNRRAWFPKVDEDFMATYQLSYGFNPDGTKNENPLKFDDEEEEELEEAQRKEEEAKKVREKGKQKKKPTWFEMDEANNTKVYVSNLPDDMTEKWFITLMQKCGMILLHPDTGRPKVKLYRDKEGNFKGDALCSYIKVESVELAEQILDGYEVGGRKIHVEKARFEQKGEYDPKLKPRKKPKKELEKIQRRQEKLFDWRPDPLRGERHKYESTVVIRNVFDPREFHTAMEKILDHKQAIRNHCSNFGKIKKLELYDLHPDGVVQVTFEEVESADLCVATLNNRLYCGRTLSVATWDGKEKFKIQETEKEREERLKKWDEFLEGKSSAKMTTS